MACSLKPFSLQSKTFACDAAQFMHRVSRSSTMGQKLFPTLLYIFVAHMLYTPVLELKERARPSIIFSVELTRVLTKFLQIVFCFLDDIATPASVDGRVFGLLLDSILRTTNSSLAPLLGDRLVTQVDGLWQASALPSPDFTALRSQFPASWVQQDSQDKHPPLSLLPFSHPLFDEQLLTVHVDAGEAKEEEDETAHLEFNTLYHDTQHWHNHKRSILPPHLGGTDSFTPMNEWQRKRHLRSEQRFMSKLQWQAETLTGAQGTPLQQIVIPCAATSKKLTLPPPAASKSEVRG